MLHFRQVKTATLTLLLCGTAKAQSGLLISFLILPSARLKLRLPGGERIHQALMRKGAQPSVLPSASSFSSCGDIFFTLLGIGNSLQRQAAKEEKEMRLVKAMVSKSREVVKGKT